MKHFGDKYGVEGTRFGEHFGSSRNHPKRIAIDQESLISNLGIIKSPPPPPPPTSKKKKVKRGTGSQFKFKFFVQSTRWGSTSKLLAELGPVFAGLNNPGGNSEVGMEPAAWLPVECGAEVLLKIREREGPKRPKPLWTEALELCGGDFAEVARRLLEEESI